MTFAAPPPPPPDGLVELREVPVLNASKFRFLPSSTQTHRGWRVCLGSDERVRCYLVGGVGKGLRFSAICPRAG